MYPLVMNELGDNFFGHSIIDQASSSNNDNDLVIYID